MVKPRPNGYSLAVKLCEHFSSNGTGLSFPALCKVFGPVYWETLDPFQKLYFKRLALHYKTTEIGTAERNGARPTNAQVVQALYGVNRLEEKNSVRQILQPIGDKISQLTVEETRNV